MSYRSMENTIREIMAMSPRPAWAEVAKPALQEQVQINEDDYKVGDEVKCKASGMEGEVIAVDPSQKGKYYTVKRDDGKTVKYAPDELEPEDDDEEEMEEQAGMIMPDPTDSGGAEEVRMAKIQLHFIKYAAEEIMEYADMVDDMDEWFQNKLSNVHNMIKGLHAYIEGDKRARGMVGEEALQEKSVSQAQQKAAGAALAAKRGEIKPSELQGASKQMYDSMTTKELEDFASTKHKGLPVRKESVELDEANVKKGDSVKIINAKKYDALSKPEVSGIVIGMLGSKVMVKVGSGQMNVDAKDLVKESVELDEAGSFRKKFNKAMTWSKDFTGSPKDMQDRIRSYSDDELRKLSGKRSPAGDGSARQAQIKMIDREMRRRGIKESVDLGEAKGTGVKKFVRGMRVAKTSNPNMKGTVIKGGDNLKNAVEVEWDSGTTTMASGKYLTSIKKNESVDLGEATDFRAGDTVYQVGSKLKGTVLHKGNQDKIVVKFGSISKMIPANQLRLAESELAVTRRADVGVEKTRTPDGKFIFKRKPKKEISVESYDRFSSVLSRAIKKKS